MVAASAGSGEGGGGKCGAGSAREFAERALADADGPVEPAALKAEYGCSGGHMRNVLSDLTDEGIAERVGYGQYLPASTPQHPPAQEAQESEGAAQEAGDERVSGAVSDEVEKAVVDGVDEEPADEIGDDLEEEIGDDVEDDWAVRAGFNAELTPAKALVLSTVIVALLVVFLADHSSGSSESSEDASEAGEAVEVGWGDA